MQNCEFKKTTTLTENEEEFIDLVSKADEDGKIFIFNLLTCFVSGGDAFTKELETIPPQDRDGVRACVDKWISKKREEGAINE